MVYVCSASGFRRVVRHRHTGEREGIARVAARKVESAARVFSVVARKNRARNRNRHRRRRSRVDEQTSPVRRGPVARYRSGNRNRIVGARRPDHHPAAVGRRIVAHRRSRRHGKRDPRRAGCARIDVDPAAVTARVVVRNQRSAFEHEAARGHVDAAPAPGRPIVRNGCPRPDLDRAADRVDRAAVADRVAVLEQSSRTEPYRTVRQVDERAGPGNAQTVHPNVLERKAVAVIDAEQVARVSRTPLERKGARRRTAAVDRQAFSGSHAHAHLAVDGYVGFELDGAPVGSRRDRAFQLGEGRRFVRAQKRRSVFGSVILADGSLFVRKQRRSALADNAALSRRRAPGIRSFGRLPIRLVRTLLGTFGAALLFGPGFPARPLA